MTYAHRKDIYDADTHMMERPDWLLRLCRSEYERPARTKGLVSPFVFRLRVDRYVINGVLNSQNLLNYFIRNFNIEILLQKP